MWEWVSRLKPATNCLRLSIQRRRMEWESACPSAAQLSSLIMDAYGQQPMTDPELRLAFLSLTELGRLKLSSTGLIWRRVQQDTKRSANNSGLDQCPSTIDTAPAAEQLLLYAQAPREIHGAAACISG